MWVVQRGEGEGKRRKDEKKKEPKYLFLSLLFVTKHRKTKRLKKREERQHSYTEIRHRKN
jgi:hypothetical protein